MPINPHRCAYCDKEVERTAEVGLTRLRTIAKFKFIQIDSNTKEHTMSFSQQVRYIGIDCGCYDKLIVSKPKKVKEKDKTEALFDLPPIEKKKRISKKKKLETSKDAYDD